MTQLVEYLLESGETVVFEVQDGYAGNGTIPVANSGGIIAKAGQSFDKALESIKPAAAALILKLKGLHEPPDEISLEFGINLNASVGAVIAATTLGANYKVTMTWKHNSKDD